MLPKINETAYTALTVPSTGKVFNFRPYLVAEEKVLLLAMEAGDQVGILDAIKNTLVACCQETLKADSLALFDFEYLFAQVRSQSVGQTTTINMRCTNVVDEVSCDAMTEVEIDVSSITIDVDPKATAIELTADHTINMRWPSYKDGVDLTVTEVGRQEGNETSQVDAMFALISNCIVSVQSQDAVYSFADESKEDVDAWLNALQAEQLKMLFDFINAVPKLSHPIDFKCGTCGHDQTMVLEGLSDFF